MQEKRYNASAMKKTRIVIVKTKFGVIECRFDSNTPEKGYTVTIPRLPGVVTCGDTLAEAKRMAKEAIELHCECLFEEGLAEVKLRKVAKTEAKVSA